MFTITPLVFDVLVELSNQLTHTGQMLSIDSLGPRQYSQLPSPSVMPLQSHAQPVRAPEPYVRETAKVGSEYRL